MLQQMAKISRHLEPFDVLNLARSTRQLNNFLMSRESRTIWRIARTYYSGLPDCPPDLSEPAYARLLFETDSCHVSVFEYLDLSLDNDLTFTINIYNQECLEPRKTKPYFILRTRLCHVCWTSSWVHDDVQGPEVIRRSCWHNTKSELWRDTMYLRLFQIFVRKCLRVFPV
jgi:hypothetical protein